MNIFSNKELEAIKSSLIKFNYPDINEMETKDVEKLLKKDRMHFLFWIVQNCNPSLKEYLKDISDFKKESIILCLESLGFFFEAEKLISDTLPVEQTKKMLKITIRKLMDNTTGVNYSDELVSEMEKLVSDPVEYLKTYVSFNCETRPAKIETTYDRVKKINRNKSIQEIVDKITNELPIKMKLNEEGELDEESKKSLDDLKENYTNKNLNKLIKNNYNELNSLEKELKKELITFELLPLKFNVDEIKVEKLQVPDTTELVECVSDCVKLYEELKINLQDRDKLKALSEMKFDDIFKENKDIQLLMKLHENVDDVTDGPKI